MNILLGRVESGEAYERVAEWEGKRIKETFHLSEKVENEIWEGSSLGEK